MRRLVANSVLAVMLGTLFAPAIVASVRQPVPICCRRGGAHHCVMTADTIASGGTVFRSNNPCPMRQGWQLGSSLIALPVSRSAQFESRQPSVSPGLVLNQYVARVFSDHLRGPPALAIA